MNFPRRIEPLASMRSSAFSISGSATPRSSARLLVVTGPRCDIQPVTIASMGSWSLRAECEMSAGIVSKLASGKIVPKALARSLATQYCRPACAARSVRPERSSISKRTCQVGFTSPPNGNAMNVCSTSWSSSASRTSGQASARTCSIAAGSSLPTSSKTDSGRILRISTARARRSSRGASSK